MSQPLTKTQVLEPLRRRFPKDLDKQADRLREFTALFMEYMAQSGMKKAEAALLLGEAQVCLKKEGVQRPKETIEGALSDVGYFKINTAPGIVPPGGEDEGARRARLEELRPIIKRVLEHPDPLRLVVKDIRACGYGGDMTAAKINYVAGTTRLLPTHDGHMPCHTANISASGEGKSYAIKRAVVAMHPPCAYHVIDSGSPKSFIYDEAPLRHRILIYLEIDSLPEGDDSPVASGLRNLLTDGAMRYDVPEKDPETNKQKLRSIIKEGPTVLMTTATHSLDGKQSAQLDTRLFSASLPETTERHAAALKVISKLTNEIEPRQPDPALIAYQEYLQLQAPWHVMIPYADALGDRLGLVAARGRIMRDYLRLLSLIKAVAILRHTKRERTPEGAVVAVFEDYETVRRLLGQVFVGATTGAPEELRLVVETVSKKLAAISLPDLQRDLEGQMSPASVQRHTLQALRSGWLVNEGEGKSWMLAAGAPLPVWAGLPTTEELEAYQPPAEETSGEEEVA